MAIKDIFITFASKKHPVMGAFVESHFKRINGRIALKELRGEHIVRFGDKYAKRFTHRLDAAAQLYLRQNKRDFRSSYGNLIVWRHSFAHEGIINSTTTYSEVVQAYEDGKQVLHCLASCMTR